MSSARNSPELFVSRVSDLSSLAAEAEAWNRLAGGVPFRRWEWVETWWRHYGRYSASPFVLTVRTAERELVGVLPCYIATSRLAGRVLRFLGSGEICSDYLSLLAAPGGERDTAEAIGRWLSETAADDWDVLEFDGVDQSEPAMNYLTDWLRSKGHRVYRRSRINGWRLQLPGTWEEYLAKVSKGRRVRIRQIVKRQFEAGRVVGHIAETVAEYERGWQIFCNLHQRRRISLGESGCFVSDPFTNFHAEVSRRFFDAGQLRLHWVELEKNPVAVDYAFTADKNVFCYQSGLNPDLLDEQPGWLDWTDSIRRAIEGGFEAFDFMRGDEPYKSIWRAEPIPLMEIRIVGRHPSAVLRDQLWHAGKSAKGAIGAAKRSVQQWWPSRSTKPAVEAEADVNVSTER